MEFGGGDGGVVSPHNNANDDSDEDEDEDEDDEQEGAVPRVVFTTVPAAENIVKEIMKKSSKGEKLALIRRLTSKAVAVEAVKMPEYKLKNPTNQGDGDAIEEEDPDEDPEARKARRKRKGRKESKAELTVPCVEVGGLLRGLLQEYREEQAHRRAAIRLMFQTAMNPGTKDEDDDDEAAAVVAAVDMQQFSAMVESLHSKVTPGMASALYRDAYDLGDEEII